MKCSQCIEEGKKSFVYVGPALMTAIYSPLYYDEDGRYHFHDPNVKTQELTCSNGHVWVEKSGDSCWCGWGQ